MHTAPRKCEWLRASAASAFFCAVALSLGWSWPCFATLDVDAGCDHDTSRRARKLEQGLGRKQLFLGLFDRRLLARGPGAVLEADDIDPRDLQFQLDARALESNVERAAAVFMGRALTLLRGGGARMAREAKPKEKQDESAHAEVTPA